MTQGFARLSRLFSQDALGGSGVFGFSIWTVFCVSLELLCIYWIICVFNACSNKFFPPEKTLSMSTDY